MVQCHLERHLPLIQCELNFSMSIFWGATLTCWEWLSSPFISFSPGLLERLLAAILPLRAMEILLPLVTWRIQEIQEIDEFHCSPHSFWPNHVEFTFSLSRSIRDPGNRISPLVTEGDRGRFGSLLVTLEPKTLASEAPTDGFCLDPYSICENIGKQMTDLTWMFFPERQALDHLVLILPALSTALSCDVAETRTSEIGR